jgi:hypothetical protein
MAELIIQDEDKVFGNLAGKIILITGMMNDSPPYAISPSLHFQQELQAESGETQLSYSTRME